MTVLTHSSSGHRFLTRKFLPLALVPILCLAAGYAIGATLNDPNKPIPEVVAEAAAETDMPTAADAPLDLTVEDRSADLLIRLGQMILPVQKASGTTYVAAELGVSVANAKLAKHYREIEQMVRLRDTFMTALHDVRQRPMMTGLKVDADALSGHLVSRASEKFEGIEDVLLLTLYQVDVPHRRP